MPEKKEQPAMAMVAHYLGIATILPSCIFVGWIMGYGLDRLFGTKFLQIVFLVIGLVAGFVQLIRDLMKETGQN